MTSQHKTKDFHANESIDTDLKIAGKKYVADLGGTFNDQIYQEIEVLGKKLKKVWSTDKRVYIIGNGGSAANAIHIANDLHYGIGACGTGRKRNGLRVEALTANSGIVTCLGNDIGYDNIFSHQISQKGEEGDLLICLSGSGNSQNIVNAIETANKMDIDNTAILGFDGGICKKISKHSIHTNINDMQMAEDIQLIVGHICMQWLSNNKP